jgi:hypothetical protein
MIYASIIYRNYKDNSLFEEGVGENNGEFYLPYRLLRKAFSAHDIELNTPDVNIGKPIAFELHINCRRQDPSARAYVYLYENPLIRPLNRNRRALSRYTKWFTWDESLMNDPRAVRLFYPNNIEANNFPGPEERDFFCVLVASNKALTFTDKRSQYESRIKIINWFERYAPVDFYLFGAGWDRPAAFSGRLGRVYNQIQKIITYFRPNRKPFKTWRGRIENKTDILKRARFCIAHENCRDLPGYITEKIFDCFRAGCVPVYVGPSEIHNYIPSKCFIDGRKFENTEKLNSFLRLISDSEYRDYQKNIKKFLRSEQAIIFSNEYFVKKIVDDIFKDNTLLKTNC